MNDKLVIMGDIRATHRLLMVASGYSRLLGLPMRVREALSERIHRLHAAI